MKSLKIQITPFFGILINSLWKRKLVILSWNFEKRPDFWFLLAIEHCNTEKGREKKTPLIDSYIIAFN